MEKFVAFTKPSRATSVARDEQAFIDKTADAVTDYVIARNEVTKQSGKPNYQTDIDSGLPRSLHSLAMTNDVGQVSPTYSARKAESFRGSETTEESMYKDRSFGAKAPLDDGFNPLAPTRERVSEGRERRLKVAFTLAEGAAHTNTLQRVINGFTLAEVLITLAIIGVVAAMTLPTLITKINDKVTANQKEVFKAKIVKGFNLTKAAGELNNTYSSTYDFLTNGLGKHLKLAKVCEPSKIRECVPYDNVTYVKSEKDETFKVKYFNFPINLNLKEEDGYKDSAAFVLGDGTVVVGSYKLDCTVDDGELDKNISKCFDGLYDLNGSRKPNKLGKDILPIRSAGINNGPAVLATSGGVKLISNAQKYEGIKTSEYCENEEPIKAYSDVGVTKCCTDCDSNGGDRWAAAAMACGKMGGRLPKEEELAAIASELHGRKIGATQTFNTGLNIDTSKIPEPLSGLDYRFTLWSSFEDPSYSSIAYGRYISPSAASRYSLNRYSSNPMAVCVVD